MEYLIYFLKWIGRLFVRSEKEINDARTVNEITIQTIQSLSEQFSKMSERFEHCDRMHQEATGRVHILELENTELRRTVLELKVELTEVKDKLQMMLKVTQS